VVARKRFGHTLALDGLTFAVTPGSVTGFVGPNGAGKSTTMRVILGLDALDEGSALIGGQQYGRLRHPLRQVGSLLDAGALQPSRTARNHLLWLAHSQGLSSRRVDEVIEQAGLESVARRKTGGFSLGMRQRLGLATAMLGDPAVLVLDEPFNGMDPGSSPRSPSSPERLPPHPRSRWASTSFARTATTCTRPRPSPTCA
jgi:ABC-2 type transport system ATP-binding protein